MSEQVEVGKPSLRPLQTSFEFCNTVGSFERLVTSRLLQFCFDCASTRCSQYRGHKNCQPCSKIGEESRGVGSHEEV